MTNSYSWGAKWIIPIDQPPIENGCLTVVDGVITSLEPNRQNDATEDLGDVALIPLFVNAHTHLEFSGLNRPLGEPGMRITDWILQVIEYRSEQTVEQKNAAIADGLKESLVCGTTGIGEIATHPWFQELALTDDILIRCFIERLGSATVVSTQIQEAKRWLNHHTAHDVWYPGVSPHAPYSVSDELFHGLLDWAVTESLPTAMHLAESREELQFMETGEGPFRDLLEALNVPLPAHTQRRPLDYLNKLSRVPKPLVVHGNYLNGKELDFIAEHANFNVIFCPRTHAYFEHAPYPLEDLLRRNIDVAIGTDSRASNPDLNMLAELQEVHRCFPDIAPEKILEMGTLAGARALQFEHQMGSLTPGKRGEFLTIPLESTMTPMESILSIEF